MSPRPWQKRREDIFFLCMVTTILAVNAIGFAHTYYLAGVFRAPLPSVWVHIHGALFTSWLLLLITQTVLVSAGRVRWHRKLGWLGAVIATLMLIAGPIALTGALRRHAFSGEGQAALIFAADIEALILFATFVAIGLAYRNRPIVHKRMMLLASIAIMAPGLSRWPFAFMNSNIAFFGIFLAFPLAIVLFDLLSRAKPLRISLIGLAVLIFYLFSAGPISQMTAMRNIARNVAGGSQPLRR